MWWERRILATASTWATGGLVKADLPDSGLLGSIQVHASRAGAVDAFNALYKWRLIDYISKVEVIVNGSTPVKSFTGEIAKAFTIYDGGGGAPDQEFNYGSSTKRAHFMINFGRRLFDRRFFLDLSKFNSVKLELTNDGTSTLFAGDWTIQLIGYFLRGADAPPSQGYLRTEELQSWTTVQNQRKYLDLPSQYRLRRLLFHVLPAHGTNNNADTQSYNVLDNIKLKIRSKKEKLFDASLRFLWYENYFSLGRNFITHLEPYHTGGNGVKTGLGQVLAKAMGQMPQGGTPGANTVAVEPGNDGDTQKLLRTGTDNYSWLMLGLGPENTGLLRFDHELDDPSTWLDLAKEKTVQLEAHTADSATADNGTVRVVTDRLVPA